MEIISYVVDGELTHGDTMGNKRTLTRGQVHYLSAGTGSQHSEHNLGKAVSRFMQIWILPDRKGHVPNYGDYPFKRSDRVNQWLQTGSVKYGAYTVKHSRIGAIWLLMLMSCQYQHLYQMAMKFSYHSGKSIFANSKLL
jgi:redox-sensitive bicupin YhaK (pirin superfamily)